MCIFRSTEEEEEDNPTEDGSNAITISVEENQTCNVAALNQFWPKVIEDIRKIGTVRRSIVLIQNYSITKKKNVLILFS